MENEAIGKRILLVEDDPQDVFLTLAALEAPLASQVAVVDNGAAALDYLYRRGKFAQRSGGDPSVVLLDNKMPKFSGLQVLQTIKSDLHLRMIPVVVLTSSRQTQDVIEFYQHGANAYVVKPVDFAEFRAAVKHLGAFWGQVNEPPPQTGKDETAPRSEVGGSPLVETDPVQGQESAAGGA